MNVTLGTAPDSWGVWFANDPLQTPWRRFLDEVASLKYEWIELGPYGYMPTELRALRSELDRRGLKITASAVIDPPLDAPDAWARLEPLMLPVCELLAALGAPYVVLIDAAYSNLKTGEMLAPRELAADAWKRLIDTVHRAADLARDRFDLNLVFHPHAETHVEYESQIEKFVADTDPARVGVCFDTGHHAYRGGDPVAFMRKHHARIPYLHVKSVDRDVQAKVEAEKIPFAKAVAGDMFCEPSRGAVDFLAFRDVLKEIGYSGFAMVEQDMYPAPFDKPLPIARRTRDYLLSIGLGT